MNSTRLNRLAPWLAALVLAAACATSVFIPFSGARWNEILGIQARLADWLPFLPQSEENNCTHGRAYWLANPDAWPVSEVRLAGLTIPKEEALRLLEIPPESGALESLTAELISAYLNRARGADPTLVDPLISEAEAILTLSEVPEARVYTDDEHARLVAQALADYNEGRVGPGCCPVPSPTATLEPSPTPMTCIFPLVYWADFPEAWPVQEVQAGTRYAQPEALDILRFGGTSTDVTILLTRQMIGARLNLATGVSLGDWQAAVDYTETWLQQHPLGSTLDPETEYDGRVVLMILEQVNNGETGSGVCPAAQITPSPTSTPVPSLTPLPSATPTATETPTASSTPTETNTPLPSLTPVSSHTPRASAQPSPSPSPSASAQPSPSAEASATPEEVTNCSLPADYWREHPLEWPPESLVVGGVEISQEQALALLHDLDSPDPTTRLVQELIAVQLNILHGADPAVVSVEMELANAWLEVYPLGSDLDEEQAQYAASLALILKDYNEGRSGPGVCSAILTPTATPTPSATPKASLQPSQSATLEASLTPSPNATPTASETPSPTPSATAEPPATPTPTASETPSPTPEPPDTYTPTPSESPTDIPTPEDPGS